LIEAVGAVDYVFQRLKTTASESCDIQSAADTCWEPSEEYRWVDLVTALSSMAVSGIAGRTFYSGHPSDGDMGIQYGIANLAAFLSQTMQESVQYDACDENNWSNEGAVNQVIRAGGTGGEVYPATSACGQLGQSYQDYKCSDTIDPETGETIPPEEMQCEVDPEMHIIAKTHAKWYGAPPPLFCAPRALLPETPRWDHRGWCPTEGHAWNQPDMFDAPFGTTNRGQIFYGPSASTDHVPPEILATKPTYVEYVKASMQAAATGDACLAEGTCCMDVENQRAGTWVSCPGGCKNGALPELVVGGEARTDVEGCCWWGRGAIQTTGVCNFGKLNFFLGKKAADRGRAALFPTVDFCKDPSAVCSADHPELRWIAGFFYWLNDVQPYDVRGARYMETLRRWVDEGASTADYSLVDMASGIVNRGCHDAPFEGSGGADPCGNGEIHGAIKRRKNFVHIWQVLQRNSHQTPSSATGDVRQLAEEVRAMLTALKAPRSG